MPAPRAVYFVYKIKTPVILTKAKNQNNLPNDNATRDKIN